MGLAMALCVLLLTSSINLCHTCHHRSHAGPGTSISPGNTPSTDIPLDSELEADRPCLACFFLNHVNTAQISLFLILLLIGQLLCLVHPFPGERFIPSHAGSALRTRASPAYLACN